MAVGAGVAALAGNSRSSSRSKQTLPLPAPLPEAITSSIEALCRSARSAVGPQANSISRWRNLNVCQSDEGRNSFLRPHQTLAPVASTSFICSAFGGALPRTLRANS